MNMYTEESSRVERAWLSKQTSQRVQEPLNPTLVNVLAFLMTIAAIALAIYYVESHDRSRPVLSSLRFRSSNVSVATRSRIRCATARSSTSTSSRITGLRGLSASAAASIRRSC